jgi:molybdopterin-guanine dinucleotide biosynthesis protein A
MSALKGAPHIETRRAGEADIPAIIALTSRVYPDEPSYSAGILRGRQAVFADFTPCDFPFARDGIAAEASKKRRNGDRR